MSVFEIFFFFQQKSKIIYKNIDDFFKECKATENHTFFFVYIIFYQNIDYIFTFLFQ